MLRIALDPKLLGWSLYRSLLWPLDKVKEGRRRDRRRDLRWAPVNRPADPIDRDANALMQTLPGPHVVFTGLGLGEFVMIDRVAAALRTARPDVRISVALRDNRAIEFARKHRRRLNVSWWPNDAIVPVARWLVTLRPDVLVLVEGYRYPVLVAAAARYGARVVLMNGRCRDRSTFRRPLVNLPHRWVFGGYAALGMQTASHVEIVRRLASSSCDLCATGDLKTDFSVPELSAEQDASLEAWLSSDLPLIAAGSTDNVEEERMVIRAFLKTRETVPCRLLLAPRHPSDLDGLPQALQAAGLSFSRRSAPSHGEVDVLLLDTQGELANAYRRCVAAYVGGSYSPRGNGHNVIEPLASGVPVAYGMQRGHFEAIQRLVEENGVGTRIADETALAAFWTRFLCDPAERIRVGTAGVRLLRESQGAVARTVEMLLAQLSP